MDRAVWLATSQDWCFLELSIGKRCLLELRDKGFEISPGGKRGEKKIVVSTNNLKKKKVQLRAFNLTQNSCYLLFMHLGLDFPSLLMQSLLDFSKRGPCSSLPCSLSWMLKRLVFRTSWLPIPIRHQYSGSVCPFPGWVQATSQRVTKPSNQSFS